MRCEKCGGQHAKYVSSRKHLWGRSKAPHKWGTEKESHAPRKDFRVKCLDCGAEYTDEEGLREYQQSLGQVNDGELHGEPADAFKDGR